MGGNPISYVDPYGLAGLLPKNFGKGKPPGPTPDPIKDTRAKNDSNENIPDAIESILCSIGLMSCIPDEAFVCLKAECTRMCGGEKYTIDYTSNKPAFINPDNLNPPTPENVPDECICVQVGIRKGGPKINPPGL